MTERPIPEVQQPLVFAELDDVESLFPDPEEPTQSLLAASTGTSAPLAIETVTHGYAQQLPTIQFPSWNSTQPDCSAENEHPEKEMMKRRNLSTDSPTLRHPAG